MNEGYREFHDTVSALVESGYKVQILPAQSGVFCVTVAHDLRGLAYRGEGSTTPSALKSACQHMLTADLRNNRTVNYTGTIKRTGGNVFGDASKGAVSR